MRLWGAFFMGFVRFFATEMPHARLFCHDMCLHVGLLPLRGGSDAGEGNILS